MPEVVKQLEVSEATYHRWRVQYGGLKADDVKRLKEPEAENDRLKRTVADKGAGGASCGPERVGRVELVSHLPHASIPPQGCWTKAPDPDIGRPGSREGEPCGNSR